MTEGKFSKIFLKFLKNFEQTELGSIPDYCKVFIRIKRRNYFRYAVAKFLAETCDRTASLVNLSKDQLLRYCFIIENQYDCSYLHAQAVTELKLAMQEGDQIWDVSSIHELSAFIR